MLKNCVAAACILIALSVLFIVSCTGDDTVTFSVVWSKTYGGTGDDSGRYLQQTSDGGFILVGYTDSFGSGDGDVLVMKLDSDGIISWQKTYGGARFDGASAIDQTTDGGYIMSGQSNTFYEDWNYDAWVVKLTSNGSISWQKTYGADGWEELTSVCETSGGGYIAAGHSDPGGQSTDLWVVKLDADGTVDWNRVYGGNDGEDTYAGIEQTTDGGYILAGRTESFGAGDLDAWVLKLNANGSVAWQKLLGGEDREQVISIQQTSDGGYIVGARTMTYGHGDKDVWILKLASDGSVGWQKTYGGELEEELRFLRQTSDGGYIVVTKTESFGNGDTDLWIMKLRPDGSVAGQKTFGGTLGESAEAFVLCSDGSIVICGETESFGEGASDVWLLKLKIGGEGDCGLGEDLDVTPQNTSVAAVDSAVSASNYSWYTTVGDTAVDPVDVSVVVSDQCGE